MLLPLKHLSFLTQEKYLHTRKLRKIACFSDEAFCFPALIKIDGLCEDPFIYIENTAKMLAFTL